jgi:anti-sigma regulatory factor (Ser/Thr protein kinase)
MDPDLPHEGADADPIPTVTDEFQPDPGEVRRARLVVEEHLRDHGYPPEVVDQAALAVSEMATNVVMHARTPFEVRCVLNGVARIEVVDHNPFDLPEVAPQGRPGPGGLGLRILATLASAWGVQVGPDRKVTWCEIGAAEHRHDRRPRVPS